MTPIFSRIWLMKIRTHFERDDGAGELAQGLAHQPRLHAHESVADLSLDLGLGYECRNRVDDDDIDGIGQEQHLGDLKGFLGATRLADQQ